MHILLNSCQGKGDCYRNFVRKHKKQSFIAIWQLQQWLVSKGFFNPESILFMDKAEPAQKLGH